MSTPNEVKTYAPANVKQITPKLMKFSFSADKMLAFIRQHANARGYINLCISPRREPGQYGDTHTCWLDTWEPDKGRAAKPKAPAPSAPDDDVPF